MKKITLLFFMFMVFFGFSQAPTGPATAPPARNATDVISIYGGDDNSYTNISGTNYVPYWSQPTGWVAPDPAYDTGGNLALKYTNFTYQGLDFAANCQNISGMEFLHLDIWTNSESPNVVVISAGETSHPVTSMPGQWQSVEIPVAGITPNLNNVCQLKFDGGTGGEIYLDNIYFYKAPADPNADATLSDLQIDGATISGFSPAGTSYTYAVATGTSVIPQITSATATQAGNGSSATLITQATAIPGDATVLVTAPDGTTQKTYTVSIYEEGPPTAAPTPPARNASDVISLYSDSYTDVASNFDAGWCGAGSVQEVTIGGNPTIKYLNNACQGIVLNAGVDASTFTHLHVDVYIEAGTDLTSSVFNLKFVQQPGGAALEVLFNVASSPALVAGSWLQLDVPVDLTTFTGFKEFGITSNLNSKVWYDNLYAYKGTALGTKDFAIEGLKVYPNPAKDNWILSTKNIKMTSIQVFDMLGKNVLSLKPNTSEAKINGANLKSGLYFAKISTANGASTLKLVKE